MSDYFPWTHVAQKRLIALQADGKTMKEIAAKLSAEFQPVTRSSISSQIAKLRRLGLIAPKAERPADRNKGGPPVKRAKKPPQTSPVVKAIEAEQPPPLIGTVPAKQDNGKGCRFIFGDPREDFSYCGRWTIDGSPYCMGHHRVCYRPAKLKEEEAA